MMKDNKNTMITSSVRIPVFTSFRIQGIVKHWGYKTD
jgi:hypothetical protein